ncbi:MAG TPA: LolA-related protein [Steroidobacteraceae bacterium]|nr:LolA-related protein [Steroidobacteraceae bacterium]
MRASNPRPAAFILALAFTLAGALVCPIGNGAPSAHLDELMSLLAQRQHGHVTFVEQHFLAVLDRPVESSGELFYDAPDRLEKRTLHPKPETLVLEHGVITAKRGRRTFTLDLSSYPQIVPLIDSIRATLAGDRASLEKIFKVTLDGGLDQWQLVLTPADPVVAKSVRRILIEGARDIIRSVEIQQADGDRSVLTIGPEVTQ